MAGLTSSPACGVGRQVELGAVAGGQDRGLGRGARQLLAQAAQRGRDLVGREREPAAQIQRRGRVVEAEGQDAHAAIIKFAALSGRRASLRRHLRSLRCITHRASTWVRSTPLASAQSLRCRPLGVGAAVRPRWPSCCGGASWPACALAPPGAVGCGGRRGLVVARPGWCCLGRDGRMAHLRRDGAGAAPWRCGGPASAPRRAADDRGSGASPSRDRTTSPRSECGSACGDRARRSSGRPARGGPSKLTMRLHSVRPISSLASLRDGPSTRMRCTVPTRLALMRRTLLLDAPPAAAAGAAASPPAACRRAARPPACRGAG